MRALLTVGVIVGLCAAVFAAWMVAHGWMEHGHLDLPHLFIAAIASAVVVLLAYRLARSHPV